MRVFDTVNLKRLDEQYSRRIWDAEKQRWIILPPLRSEQEIWIGDGRYRRV